MKKQTESYNGWKNYETWNVALWIQNDEGLLDLARACYLASQPYQTFVSDLKEGWGDESIGLQTPDGVAWNDSGLDIDALNEMVRKI